MRLATDADFSALSVLVKDVGLFDPSELDDVVGMLRSYCKGKSPGEYWAVYEDKGEIVGTGYYVPERMTVGCWNVLFLGVHPTRRGQGIGRAIMQWIEEKLRSKKQRVLLVETQGDESFARQRRFYQSCGFVKEATIREYYDEGFDKVVFWKRL